MVYLVIVGLLCVMAVVPDAPVSRMLHRVLVERPAAFLNRLTPRRILVWCALFGFMVIAPFAAPELMVLLVSFGDTALLFEVWMAVWASGVASGAGAIVRRLKEMLGLVFAGVAAVLSPFRRRGESRSTRVRSGRKLKPPSDDPEPVWAPNMALAA